MWLHPQEDAVLIDVLVSPRASRTRIVGVHDERLKIHLAAPPVDGKANDLLVRFLADMLEVSRAQIEIVGGPSGRRKTVRLSSVGTQRALLKLAPRRS
ncbi:MAG: DUF167 domain-containing protein [Myxococcota bacterium]